MTEKNLDSGNSTVNADATDVAVAKKTKKVEEVAPIADSVNQDGVAKETASSLLVQEEIGRAHV